MNQIHKHLLFVFLLCSNYERGKYGFPFNHYYVKCPVRDNDLDARGVMDFDDKRYVRKLVICYMHGMMMITK